MKDDPKAPSELMERVIRSGGSLVADCKLCGRTHFATMEANVYDAGELEALRTKAKAEPDKYIEDPSYDSIPWGRIDGKQAVLGCPCNGLRHYEDFIWQNRHVILDYLERRAAERMRAARADTEAVTRAHEAGASRRGLEGP